MTSAARRQAERDQADAAADHAARVIADVATITANHLATGVDVDATGGPIRADLERWHRIVTAQIVPTCGHLTSPQPCLGLLGGSEIACTRCAESLIAAHTATVPADECDTCHAPTTVFREVMVQAGALMLTGNVCRSCWAAWSDNPGSTTR